MAAVAHNPEFAKKVGISQKVGKDFNDADKGRKFKEGGETKAIADAEMKALKRGHAPKEVLDHERAEHKAMGYKEGGKVHKAHAPKEEMKQKGYAMAETKGGRPTPHGKHDSEGDHKLKGFGMGKGTGKGRSVTKAEKPKDEEPRKGFAMKKGGKVHKMAGGGAARHRPMPAKLPQGLGSALAGATGQAGPPMGAPAPMPGGPPGMKKGGEISHHHHHYYAKGGHVKKMDTGGQTAPGAGQTPQMMQQELSYPAMRAKLAAAQNVPPNQMPGAPARPGMKHGGEVRHGIDRKAERGHTKGKHIKMAHGGHVRGNGIAQKGHTRGRVV